MESFGQVCGQDWNQGNLRGQQFKASPWQRAAPLCRAFGTAGGLPLVSTYPTPGCGLHPGPNGVQDMLF